MQVTDWLKKRAVLSPGSVALVDVAADLSLTYLQFNERTTRLARWFQRALGIRKGDRVALLSGNRAECLECLFAASKIGAVYVPVNYKLSPAELISLFRDFEPRVLVYSAELIEQAEAITREVLIEFLVALDPTQLPQSFSYRSGAESDDRAEPEAEAIDYEDPQMILYTSGTAGNPKGVILSHRMTVWNCFNTMLRDLLPTDSTVIHTPLFYTGGLNVYTNPLFLAGGTVYLLKQWDAGQVLGLIEAERISIMFAVPTQFYMMVHSPRFESTDLRSLRFVISGGAPCPVSIIERFQQRGVTFKQGFGMTEVGVNCFCLDAEHSIRKAGSIGTPNFFVDARIADENGSDLGTNQVGELLLRSPAMFSGYWKNHKATSETLRDGWIHTGDLARRDDEGFFYIVDRKKDMYISGGENVYPAEIERVFLQHPAVAEVAVIGVPHEKWGEVGAAYVVLKPGAAATERELLDFCTASLAKYKTPKSVYFFDALPKGQTGKILKRVLRDPQRRG